jgi:hypothetical protein
LSDILFTTYSHEMCDNYLSYSFLLHIIQLYYDCRVKIDDEITQAYSVYFCENFLYFLTICRLVSINIALITFRNVLSNVFEKETCKLNIFVVIKT